MRFFENQDRARRNTGLLLLLLILAVAFIAIAVDLVFYAILVVEGSEGGHLPLPDWLFSRPSLVCLAVVILIIGFGTLVRFVALRDGGKAVAKMVGARRIESDPKTLEERRLRNVVEEMAIASGVTMPELYVMEQETTINAFVAGYQANEAVMVVTSGALQTLNRDELQGVVAHEFSHILNGDMRTNIRLIALLAGILMIGQIGQFLMRVAFSGRRTTRSSRNDAGPALGLLGLGLVIVGFIGVFFGRLIKSAISRQREFLADASAVQFTRNPEGIGGALYKIGLNLRGGRLEQTSHAEDLNHLCFAESVKMAFGRLLGSHPPIDERIEAIDEQLLARMRARYGRPGSARAAAAQEPLISQREQTVSAFADAASAQIGHQDRSAHFAPLSSSVGAVTPVNEAYAEQILAQLPKELNQRLHTTNGAVQFTYALMLTEASEDMHGDALEALTDNGPTRPQPTQVSDTYTALKRLGHAFRLPALELALPALRQLGAADQQLLLQSLQKIAEADQRITLHEFAVLTFLRKHLDSKSSRVAKVKYRSFRGVMPALQTVLWLMARAGTADEAAAGKLYSQAMSGFEANASPPEEKKISANRLVTALKMLSGLSPMLKPAVLDACGECVLHDGKVATREYELLRLVADQLDCPMPPLPVGPARRQSAVTK
ncbi:M48 family metallopeptidase [Marinobacteraceae bacterium S3BR75-40.1]